MKRKKWSELEEQTLLTKYSDLLNSGTLPKLRTREKKFKPIADYVNSMHHFQDPAVFPFKWSWRDVSIKVQNMRHQYLGVKQKIRGGDGGFCWDDGVHHWENFLKYRDVFGDVELDVKGCDRNKSKNNRNEDFSSNVEDDDLGLGLGFEMVDCEEFDEDEDEEGEEHEEEKVGKRRIALLGASVMELREAMVKREEGRKEGDFVREEGLLVNEGKRRRMESLIEREMVDEERGEERRLELEEMEMRLEKRVFDREVRLERELEEERRWRMKMEDRREEEEMEWRERMLGLQLEHEKQMMQMHVDATQNQMQILGIMCRFMCQFFGTGSDGLSVELGSLHSQVLESLHHPGPGDLGNNKPESDSPPEFI